MKTVSFTTHDQWHYFSDDSSVIITVQEWHPQVGSNRCSVAQESEQEEEKTEKDRVLPPTTLSTAIATVDHNAYEYDEYNDLTDDDYDTDWWDGDGYYDDDGNWIEHKENPSSKAVNTNATSYAEILAKQKSK
jgi:hypothetical protein